MAVVAELLPVVIGISRLVGQSRRWLGAWCGAGMSRSTAVQPQTTSVQIGLLPSRFSKNFSGFAGGGTCLVKDVEQWVAITRQDFAQISSCCSTTSSSNGS